METKPLLRKTLRTAAVGAPFAYMALIWYLSSQPHDAVVSFRFYDVIIKESLHLVEFAVLYVLWLLHAAARGRLSLRDSAQAAVLALAYSAVDEIHQAFVPSRSATWVDLIKNSAGVAAAWYILRICYFRRPQSRLAAWVDAAIALLHPDDSQSDRADA